MCFCDPALSGLGWALLGGAGLLCVIGAVTCIKRVLDYCLVRRGD